MTILERLNTRYGPALEAELRSAVPADETLLSRMVAYHLGWVDAEGRPAAADPGKRIRPLLLLLACDGVGGDWQKALPAAAALELLHNFTLIHDDIQDRSPERRRRPAVWAVWGTDQAINAGDGLFAVAFRKLTELADRGIPPAVGLECVRMLAETCWVICQGQVADLELAARPAATLAEYFDMVRRKTAALIGTAVGMGVLAGGGGAVEAAREFGEALGIAFQVRDDYLGIWGRREITGKPAGDDLRERKKTLPVVWALTAGSPELRGLLADAYARPELGPELASVLADRLAEAGAEAFTHQAATEWLDRARSLLTTLPFRADVRVDFADLIDFVATREF
jgi:geranylgeranyl diphosphate synthase type I